MTNLVIKIYNWMQLHRMARHVSFVAVTALLLCAMARLQYKENIADFLPLDSNHQQELAIYQEISGADKIIAVFQYRDSTKADPSEMEQAIDSFVDYVTQHDTANAIGRVTSRVDLDRMAELSSFVYANIPYFLSDADYTRIDSLLAAPGYMASQLAADRSMLMQPAGSVLSTAIRHDPLNLFAPVVARLQSSADGTNYAMQDGYIFSPDLQRAFVTLESPYGSSETENNARLIDFLHTAAEHSVDSQHANVEVRLMGGPVIAVGNSRQIKSDSILSVTIAVVLILALLLVAFRNVWHLVLIAASIGWGWLFAMGALSVFHNDASIIVVGISSVILGIAVNYPLHFIAHLQHTPDKRKALREIVVPLFVGNITTVGSFLALVPLQSVALRDLGVFASFLLIGTIVFVLIYLPHVTGPAKQVRPSALLQRMGNVSLDSKPAVLWIVAALTVIFGIFSLQTKFDTNMSHINYMTAQQKADMAYFQKEMLGSAGSSPCVYAVATGKSLDEALDNELRLQPCIDSLARAGIITKHTSLTQFITPQKEQSRRLALWHDFLLRHPQLLQDLRQAAVQAGFAPHSFDKFSSIISKDYTPQSADHFSMLTAQALASCVSRDKASGTCSTVSRLAVDERNIGLVEQSLAACGAHAFDVASMNSAIANNLSDDFNYIGWACGCIVFFFLWLSFGSLELAISSFIPMAVSWVWILGIMAIFGIQFNIVNVILASFIFGQGDDYTIFMTEGASYEYAYRRKMLASYKHSIIISALIMFIGIGTLVIAKHPALRSLAEVTIAGMFSVVLMAYLFPPLIFKFMVKSHGNYRTRPLSACRLLAMVWLHSVSVLAMLRPSLRKHRQKAAQFIIAHLPGVEMHLGGIEAKGSVIVCKSQSPLDALILAAMTPKLVFINASISAKPGLLQRFIARHSAGCLSQPVDYAKLADIVAKGCNIAVVTGGIDELKTALRIAARLHADIVPVAIFGPADVLPHGSCQLFTGTIEAKALPHLSSTTQPDVLSLCIEMQISDMRTRIVSAAYFKHLVQDRYRYKGVDIVRNVNRNLRRHNNYAAFIDHDGAHVTMAVVNAGYGEFALLYALVHPGTHVVAWDSDPDKRAVLRYSAMGLADNLTVTDNADFSSIATSQGTQIFALGECPASVTLPEGLTPTVISV